MRAQRRRKRLEQSCAYRCYMCYDKIIVWWWVTHVEACDTRSCARDAKSQESLRVQQSDIASRSVRKRAYSIFIEERASAPNGKYGRRKSCAALLLYTRIDHENRFISRISKCVEIQKIWRAHWIPWKKCDFSVFFRIFLSWPWAK